MKTTNTIEQALDIYKETVSPSEKDLFIILNQLPEKEIVKKEKTAVRSPYIWIAVLEAVTLSIVLVALLPTFQELYTYRNSNFYAIDKQVEHFDLLIDKADNNSLMLNYQ